MAECVKVCTQNFGKGAQDIEVYKKLGGYSNISERLFNMSRKQMMVLVGCGAAGAIAGIFKAPLAGVLFTLEVLMFDMTMTTAVPLLISVIKFY